MEHVKITPSTKFITLSWSTPAAQQPEFFTASSKIISTRWRPSFKRHRFRNVTVRNSKNTPALVPVAMYQVYDTYPVLAAFITSQP
jgi:hypothetical protein